MALPALAPGPVQLFPKSMGGPYLKVEIDFASNWNTASPTWTDVTRAIRLTPNTGVTFTRGRNDEYQQVVPGSFTITFNNLDRRFDPTYPGPYNTGGNQIDGARPTRITLYYPDPGTAYIQFLGQVEEWIPTWPPGKDAYTTATGIDFLGVLSYARGVSLGSISTTAQARLTELCTYGGIPTSRYSFTLSGSYSLLKQTYPNTDLLSACQQVAGGQNWVLYTTRDGIIKTIRIFNSTSMTGDVFGESSGEIPLAKIDLGNAGAYNYTQVIMQAAAQTGGTAPSPATANVSSAYVNRYGIRPIQRNIAAITLTDEQSAATALAAAIAALPNTRVKQAQIRPMRAPAAAFPVVLKTELFARYTFKYLPPGGGPRFVEDCLVQQIQHTITSSDYLVSWMMSPVAG